MATKYTLTQHPSGLCIRNEISADSYVIGELSTYDAFKVYEDDVVLDLGANIGAMANRFLRDGARLVVAVEPFPDNAAMVKKNLAEFSADRWELIEAAVVGPETGETLVLKTPDTNWGMISRVRHNVPYAVQTGEITVSTVQFQGLLDTYHPTAIKCDIEGGEYDFKLALTELPETVTRLAIEFHSFEEGFDDHSMYENALYIDQRLIQEGGFELIARSGVLFADQHSAELRIYSRPGTTS